MLPHTSLLLSMGSCCVFQLVALEIPLSQWSLVIPNFLSKLLFPGRGALGLWVWPADFVSRCLTSHFLYLYGQFCKYLSHCPVLPIAPLLCSSDYLHVWVSISFYTSISQVKMLQNKYPREPIRNPPLQVWFLAYRTCACNFKSGIQCSFFFPLFFFYYIRIPYVYLKLLYQCCYFNNRNCTITKRSSKLLGKTDFL